MCTHPIYIKNPKAGRLQYLPSWNYDWKGRYFDTSLSGFTVPCGKCLDCLHRKQMSRVPQYVRELEQHKDNVFVTLTYRNSRVPLALSIQDKRFSVDYDTGEVVSYFDSSVVKILDEEDKSVYLPLFGYKLSGKLKSFSVDNFIDNETWRITPSLNREDVRLYIKRKRIEFKRAGNELDFKYICIGEYGPRTSRPHYHLLVCGMDYSTANLFFKDWSLDFGFVCIKTVSRDYGLKNGQKVKDGYMAVSRYVSKYMSKGCFECDCVRFGWVQKCRVMVSVGFGCQLTDKEYSYYSPAVFSSSFVDVVLSKRNYFSVSGVKYPLPSSWKRRLRFKLVKYDSYDELLQKSVVRYRYAPIPLQIAVSASIRNRFNDLRMRQLRKDEDFESPHISLQEHFDFVEAEKSRAVSTEEFRYADLRKFYARSRF